MRLNSENITKKPKKERKKKLESKIKKEQTVLRRKNVKEQNELRKKEVKSKAANTPLFNLYKKMNGKYIWRG